MIECDNQQKYLNYKVQMRRLKKAMDYEFYLEAIFIEYVILEDRTASILRYEGNSVKPRNENGYVSIEAKINKIIKVAENKSGIAHKYFSSEFMAELIEWKNKRNRLMHALMKQKLTSAELKTFAEEGLQLVKDLSRITKNYKGALLRKGLIINQ